MIILVVLLLLWLWWIWPKPKPHSRQHSNEPPVPYCAAEVPPEVLRALAELELRWPTSLKQVRSAYKRLAMKYHPDRNGLGVAAKMRAINEAYARLQQYFV